MKLHISFKSILHQVLSSYSTFICKREYVNQKFDSINERSVEFGFLFRQLTKVSPRTILDVGTGKTALPHLMRNCGFIVTAIDNIRDYWKTGMINRHFYVIDDDITNTKLLEKFDFITCISVLEHITNFKDAVKCMFSLLNSGGHLVITFPYNEDHYIKNVYELSESNVTTEYPFVTQVYSRNEIDQWLSENDGSIVEQEYWKFFTGDYWTCGEMIVPPIQVNKSSKHQISCIIIKKDH